MSEAEDKKYLEHWKIIKKLSEDYSESVRNSNRRGLIKTSVSVQIIDALTTIGRISSCISAQEKSSEASVSIEKAMALTAAKSRGTWNINEAKRSHWTAGTSCKTRLGDYLQPLSKKLYGAVESLIKQAEYLTNGERVAFQSHLESLTYEKNIEKALEACPMHPKRSEYQATMQKALNAAAQTVLSPLEKVRFYI